MKTEQKSLKALSDTAKICTQTFAIKTFCLPTAIGIAGLTDTMLTKGEKPNIWDIALTKTVLSLMIFPNLTLFPLHFQTRVCTKHTL